ncbi:GntR family transcriptional regulator [Geothermobacter ehrlichii]|uniref:GntR family transcriptional regulator n=1 Tax=Geothermobacter ehrlichii TaxID=213224 RepID=A0A5D3WME7_9BACT|nr:GntR family transcriptional regulator [Geothermobacter ehrlichii]TYO98498.1 GntR family transcriptional regulator [Geothermobacter ehrlichii]
MAIPKTTYKDYVTQFIYNGIMERRFKPGTRILENELSIELGISRAPVREALRELVGEGLLSYQPQKGHTITRLDADQVIDCYETRGVIEGYAAALATPHLTEEELEELFTLTERMTRHARKKQHRELIERGEEFHSLILSRCPNRELLASAEKLSRKLHILFFHYWGTLYSAEEVASRHRLIVESLVNKNAGHIEETVRRHYFETGRKIASLPEMIPNKETS